MEITDIRIRHTHHDGKLKAVASITIDDVLVVHEIKIIEGTKGLFIAMPARQDDKRGFIDIVHPINSELREELQRMILEKYYSSEEWTPET